jgi:type III secretion system FlhB-like substrate exporter
VSYRRIDHPIALTVALVLAVLAGVVAIGAIWANDQLLSTGSWVSVSGRMLDDKEVRHRVAEFLGEELTNDTAAQLNAAGQGEIAEEVVPRLRAQQTHLAERVMRTKQFKPVWLSANRAAHRALLRVLDEEGKATEEGVVVDLTPALRQIADLVEREAVAGVWATNLADLVEPGAARIKVLEAAELQRAQDVVRVIRHLTAPAVIVALALYALALILGRRRLSPTFVGVGLALAATGALALLARALAGHAIVDRLLSAGTDRDAADAAWNIATSKVADLAGIAIGLGAVIVLLVAAAAIFRKALEGRTVAA